MEISNKKLTVKPLQFLWNLLFVVVMMQSYQNVQAAEVFYTTAGIGPDKWASVWLLERHGAASVSIVSQESLASQPSDKIFDEPGSRFSRTGSSTAYSSLLDGLSLRGDVYKKIGELVHEIEIDAWRQGASLHAGIVEQGFRNMQLRYGREAIGKQCYLEFFDNVASHIRSGTLTEVNSSDALIPASKCQSRVVTKEKSDPLSARVPTLSLDNVLQLVSGEASPVFVDTRERWEFDEGHIPGAINMKVRDINQQSAASLRSAEWVIAYCVKDFRGYEAAKKLRSHGVNAIIMTPHGLRGWIDNDLPVAGEKGATEQEAMAELQLIAEKLAAGVVE